MTTERHRVQKVMASRARRARMTPEDKAAMPVNVRRVARVIMRAAILATYEREVADAKANRDAALRDIGPRDPLRGRLIP